MVIDHKKIRCVCACVKRIIITMIFITFPSKKTKVCNEKHSKCKSIHFQNKKEAETKTKRKQFQEKVAITDLF